MAAESLAVTAIGVVFMDNGSRFAGAGDLHRRPGPPGKAKPWERRGA